MNGVTKKRERLLRPIRERTVSARKFLDLTSHQNTNIESTAFIPPRKTGEGYGRFKIKYKVAELV